MRSFEPRALALDQLADAVAVDLDGGADGHQLGMLVGTTSTGSGERWTSRQHDRAEDRPGDRVLADRADDDRARADLLRDVDQHVRRLAGDEPRLDLDAGGLEVGDGATDRVTSDLSRAPSRMLPC